MLRAIEIVPQMVGRWADPSLRANKESTQCPACTPVDFIHDYSMAFENYHYGEDGLKVTSFGEIPRPQ